MQKKTNLNLEDMFTEEFLIRYNLKGTNGKKKLEGLIPYERIFVRK